MKIPNPKNIGNHLPSGADMKRWAGKIPHPKAATWNKLGNGISDKSSATWDWVTTGEHYRHGGNRAVRMVGGLAFLATAVGTLGIATLGSRLVLRSMENGRATNPLNPKQAWNLARAEQLDAEAAKYASRAATAHGREQRHLERESQRFSKDADRWRGDARPGKVATLGIAALDLIGHGVHPTDLSSTPFEATEQIVGPAYDEVHASQRAADNARFVP